MKRFLLTLICCSPLLFSPPSSFSLELIGPNGEQAVSYEQYGPISDIETLWGIATKLRPDRSVTVQQTLVAIYKINPDAFYQGNINKIIPESVIKVPEPEFIQAQTVQEAVALINKYSTAKQPVKKQQSVSPVIETVSPVIETVSPTKEKVQQVAIAEPEKPVLAAENLADKNKLIALENELNTLRNEFDVVNEQLLVTAENNQRLKLKLQPLYDQLGDLKEQVESELLINAKLQNTVDDYRAQLDAVKERPFSGEGLFNEILRLITSSLTNLLIVIISPVLLLLVIFVLIMRLNSKRLLAEQEQELAESTAILMEESGKFDSLLTEDIVEEPELDFTSDDSLVQDTKQPEEVINENLSVSLEDELECIDLTDTDDINSEAAQPETDAEDPFGIEALADTESSETDVEDPFGIEALADTESSETDAEDPFGIEALADTESPETDTDDPFGIAALAEEEELISPVAQDDSLKLSDEQQADLDLAAEWENQLSEQEVDSVENDKTLASHEIDLSELEAADIEKTDLSTAAEDKADEIEFAIDDAEQITDSHIADENSENLPTPDLETAMSAADLAESELDLDDSEQVDASLLEGLSVEPVNEKVDHDESELLAKQLSDVAFNGDVPLPKVDAEQENDFIDIETLLENSNEEVKDEPYSELDLDLGLDEFPDVINTEGTIDIDDDESGVAAQLDLARAYLEIDDKAGAKKILLSVVEDSDGTQRVEIEKLLSRLA